jgi:Ca-activated chloride channel family protein
MRTLVLIALVGLFLRSSPGAEQYAVVVDVDLVVFNVAVTDSRGRQVSGLKASDFQVRESDRLQEIKLFVPEDVPATIGLIIDNSGSMRNKQSDVIAAALSFAAASHSEDEIFIVSFNETVRLDLPPSVPFTSNRELLRSSLVKSIPVGLTALYDAIAAGIEHLKVGTRDHKALVVLSDGGDNASRRHLDDVLELAKRSSATIYTIGFYEPENLDRNPRVLRKLAEVSGGKAYFPESVRELDKAWNDVAGSIRGQYTIGYLSTNHIHDGKFRKVEITPSRNSRRGLRMNTRDGYFARADNKAEAK